MTHITKEQRYTIASMLEQGYKPVKIALTIGKDKSVISREVRRNRDQRNGRYSSDLANRKALVRQSQKKRRVSFTPAIKKRVDELLTQEQYSPEQIAGFMKKNNEPHVSHETIYQYIWKRKKKGGSLHEHLRRRGRSYRKRGNLKDTRGIIVGRRDINERSKQVEDRSRFGDLEIDTIIGKNHQGAIVTINDRASGMLFMKRVTRRTADLVAQAAIELLKEHAPILKTITADNGKEFANHDQIATQLALDFFFAKPYSSWERGSNENLNGLIRQYIPKKTDFETLTEKQIKTIETKLNNRPRKRLGYESPIFVMNQLIKLEKAA